MEDTRGGESDAGLRGAGEKGAPMHTHGQASS
jgi:hypothetical protein